MRPTPLALVLSAGLTAVFGVMPAAGQTRFVDVSAEALPWAATSMRVMDVEPIDLDVDGRMELVLASEFGPNVILADARAVIGRGGVPRFEVVNGAIPQAKTGDSEDVAVADFDGDGVMDLLFAAEDDRAHELYLGLADPDPKTGAFFRDVSERIGVSPVANAVIAVDVDRDGDADVVMGCSGEEIVLLNDGTGVFTAIEEGVPQAIDSTQDVEAGDLNGDGILDFVAGNESRTKIYLGNGDGTFRDGTSGLPTRLSEEIREADLGDVDGDGDLDLLLVSFASQPGKTTLNRLLLNDGAGVFEHAKDGLPSDVNNQRTVDGDFVDLDGDGDLDIVLTNFVPPSSSARVGVPLQVFINDGSGVFEDATGAWIPEIDRKFAGVDVEVLDLNGDGKLDLYASNYLGPDVLLIGR